MIVLLLCFPLIAFSACLSQYEVQGIGVECRYMCDDPVCHAICAPDCTTPACTIQCNPGHTCIQTTPICTTRCATDVVPSDTCPACETICNPLPSICVGQCSVLCEAPACTWSCRKPTNCRFPLCELQCERPACESTTPCFAPFISWSGLLLLVIIMFAM